MTSFYVNPYTHNNALFGQGLPNFLMDSENPMDLVAPFEDCCKERKRLLISPEDGFLRLFGGPPANRPYHERRFNQSLIQTDADGNRRLKCSLRVRDFKPDEVNVTVDTKNHCITVEGNHETKDDQERTKVKRHYVQRLYLPEDAQVDFENLEVKSTLSKQGLLSIEAPLPKLEKPQPPAYTPVVADDEPVVIPVKRI